MNAPSKKLTDSSKFPASELMRFNFCLDSMPTAPFDMEKKSMLDWYFDCDGEQHSLQEMLKHPLTSVPAAGAPRSGGGANMQASALLPEKLPETSSPKLERYTKFNAPDSDYFFFQLHLQLFRDKIQHLAAHCPNDPKEPECEEQIIWRRRKFFGLDRGPKHDVWLALGWLENGFHKPVAVKRNDESPKDKAKLKFIMRRLKPGSFIASAEFVEIEPLVLEGDDDEEEEEEKHSSNGEEGAPVLQRQQSDPRQFRWVSEAGVCTLEELFGRKLNPNDKIERNTKAHRILVKEILHSMALAVFHLHECRIAHCCISLRYFKVFLIQEPPRSTNLRVKLVSMRKANILTSVDERTDIEALGHAMARVILGWDYDSANASSIEQLLQYDPALYWLISWILDKTNGATLADVIRHPYFMSLNEKEVFTLALAGGVFGQILSAAELDSALTPLKTKMLFPFLDNLYRQLTTAPAVPSAGEVPSLSGSMQAAARGGQPAERSGQVAGGSRTTAKDGR